VGDPPFAAGAEGFGNGAAWPAIVAAAVDDAAVRSWGHWFLVLRPRPLAHDEARALPSVAADDPTGGISTALPRSPSGGFVGAGALALQTRMVFRVARRASSTFDFVSVGRNEHNDVFLPDASVSRFHAYLRESDGRLAVLDAKSGNGTYVRGDRVPQQGQGAAVLVLSGDSVRFGDVHGVLLDVAGLFRLVQSAPQG
jgi:hypothetical protein